MVIKPTLGRVVWYRASEHVVNAAIIAHVNEDGTVNLAVFNMFGEPYKEAHVIVFQGDSGEEGFNIPRYHCGWMPYQKIAAAKNANDTNLDEWHEPNKSK